MKRVSLDVVEIESPCEVPWESMQGDDRKRSCATCKKDVFDLSVLTREDAEALVTEHRDLCIQLVRRADGTLVTADCTPIRLALLRKAARRSLALAAAMAGAIAAALGGVGWLLQDEPLCTTSVRQGDLVARVAAALADKQEAPHERYPRLRGRMRLHHE